MTPEAVYSLPGFAEPFSAISHLAGAGVFAVLGWVLVRHASEPAERIPLLVFSLSVVTLLAVSGATHMFGAGGTPRGVLSRIDGAAIFVLIAGTHTAVHGLFFRGAARLWPIVAAWVLVIATVAILTTFHGLAPAPAMVGIYLAFGWGVGLTGMRLARELGLQRMLLPLAGGVTYSLGSLLLVAGRPHLVPGVVGPHELWHLAVIGGVFAYWLFLYRNTGARSKGALLSFDGAARSAPGSWSVSTSERGQPRPDLGRDSATDDGPGSVAPEAAQLCP